MKNSKNEENPKTEDFTIKTDVLDISLWLLSVCFENGLKCDIISTDCVKIEVDGQLFLIKVKSLKNTFNNNEMYLLKE